MSTIIMHPQIMFPPYQPDILSACHDNLYFGTSEPIGYICGFLSCIQTGSLTLLGTRIAFLEHGGDHKKYFKYSVIHLTSLLLFTLNSNFQLHNNKIIRLAIPELIKVSWSNGTSS